MDFDKVRVRIRKTHSSCPRWQSDDLQQRTGGCGIHQGNSSIRSRELEAARISGARARSPESNPATNGSAVDRNADCSSRKHSSTVPHVDVASRQLTRIAEDTNSAADQIQTPDDLTIGPYGNLYVTIAFTNDRTAS